MNCLFAQTTAAQTAMSARKQILGEWPEFLADWGLADSAVRAPSFGQWWLICSSQDSTRLPQEVRS